MSEEVRPENKKRFTPIKAAILLLALAGLGLVSVWAYRGFLQVKAWLSSFGTGAYWILGLIAGFIYFYAVHRVNDRLKVWPSGSRKIGAYTILCLFLLVLNPLSLSLGLWLYSPSETWIIIGHWFFIGCSVGTGIVVVLERLFAKKTLNGK